MRAHRQSTAIAGNMDGVTALGVVTVMDSDVSERKPRRALGE
jgi:hypothetical protein